MIATGVALAITTTLTANIAVAEEAASWTDDFEVSGEIKNETAVFTKAGTTIGAATAHKSKDIMKSESSARIFINGPVAEGVEMHAELRPVRDGQAVDGYKGHEDYTQQDFLRELYVDTEVGEEDEVSLRIGKQQVVWGTADGMKLLDIINPTDYREMAQNSMEDSRIPVWMINAETDLEDGGNVQLVISQPRENLFAGLNRNIDTNIRVNSATGADLTSNGHDQGHAFVMKGVDTITGKTNGFLNGVPDLGSIAGGFAGAFIDANGSVNNLTNAGAGGFTVAGFAQMSNANIIAQVQPMLVGAAGAGFGNVGASPADNMNGLIALGYDGSQILAAFSNPYDFNLIDATNAAVWSGTNNPNSMFEYMDRTSFATFNTFVSASSQYAYDMPDDTDVDAAVRIKNSTSNGLNYSLNYSYNYDKNPVIDLSWNDPNTGEKLNVAYNSAGAGAADSAVVSVTGSKGIYGATAANGNATLRFTETLKRSHNIGGALDTAIETESLGSIVLRGEALYQKDVYSPIFNRGKLAIGDLVGALNMTKGDRFKYVLGADVTVLTNMMVSAQFIQDRNLDYVDSKTDWDGSACTAADGVNCGVYTADFASMHMTNGFNKAEKNKEFYSFFMSKPFGAEQQHRWNNIFMFEENGGKWNRADVEYSFSDEIIGSAEYNKYWGDENTQFGQLEKSSNFQLGLKYIF